MEKVVPNGFELVWRDRVDHEKLLLMVFWGDIVLCELNKERGEDQTEMKLYCNDVLYNNREIKFPLMDFMEAMRVAQEELKRL